MSIYIKPEIQFENLEETDLLMSSQSQNPKQDCHCWWSWIFGWICRCRNREDVYEPDAEEEDDFYL